MDTNKECILKLIKMSIWEKGTVQINQQIYEELRNHTVSSLPAPVLSNISMEPELRMRWKKSIIYQLSAYMKYTFFQNSLPISVPYVILKGTAAAKYYPYPEYRDMGDIDIMTRPEDFDKACQEFLTAGFSIQKRLNREVGFAKDNIVIELHRYFAALNDPKQAKYLDDLIIDNINPSHNLPDMVNGLVLLEHISQHLENGLGLRQIVDWMMFVDKCLPDEKWPVFQKMAQKTGMETLAITTTKMCEIYLGLSEHQWCKNAKNKLCAELIEYVLSCGNFGSKLDSKEQMALLRGMQIKHPIGTIKNMQRRGKEEWSGAQKPFLRPFAWAWRGLQLLRENPKLLGRINEANQLDRMLDNLKVKRNKRGLAEFEDGQFVKKRKRQ